MDVTQKVLLDLFGDQGIDKMNDFKKTIIDSYGATKKAAKENSETSFEAYMRMQSAIDGVKQEIFEGLKPAFKDLTAMVSQYGNAISDWLKENPNFIQDLAKTAKTIFDLIPAFLGLAAGIMIVIKAIQAGAFIAGIFGATAGSIVTIVILIIAALAALAAIIWLNWDIISNYWIKAWYDLEAVVFEVVDWMIEKVKVIKDFWIDAFTSIGQSVWEFLAQPLLAVVKIADKVAKFAGGEGFSNMIYTLEMYGNKGESASAASTGVATAPIPSRETTNNIETRYIFLDKNGTETDLTKEGDHGWFSTSPVPMN